MENDLVTIIIPSYNRYNYLLNAISSVKKQSYKNYEILVIDDGSTDPRYKNKIDGVSIINLEKSSNEILGFSCGAVARNDGIKRAKGEYIAFLDDDDIWMPEKLEIQINEMKKNNIDISCTDGYIGNGFYNHEIKYKMYNGQFYFQRLKEIYNFKEDFPDRFDLKFVSIHNPIITSSICIKKNLIDKVGFMKLIKNGGQIINGKKEWQDWDFWKRLLKYTDCLYIKKPLIYYDTKL